MIYQIFDLSDWDEVQSCLDYHMQDARDLQAFEWIREIIL